MKFLNLRKLVISALTASVVLTSASGFLSLFPDKSIAKDFNNNEVSKDEQPIIDYSMPVSASVDGDWLLNWKANNFSHKAKLSLSGGSGDLIVEISRNGKKLKKVKQAVVVELSPVSNEPTEIVGSSPTDLASGKSLGPDAYTPDRFKVTMIEEAKEGSEGETVDFSANPGLSSAPEENERNFKLENCDGSNCVPVSIKPL